MPELQSAVSSGQSRSSTHAGQLNDQAKRRTGSTMPAPRFNAEAPKALGIDPAEAGDRGYSLKDESGAAVAG